MGEESLALYGHGVLFAGPESNPRYPASNLQTGVPHQMLWF